MRNYLRSTRYVMIAVCFLSFGMLVGMVIADEGGMVIGGPLSGSIMPGSKGGMVIGGPAGGSIMPGSEGGMVIGGPLDGSIMPPTR
jgi:hypothetical protein